MFAYQLLHKVNLNTGLLESARYAPSTHYNERPSPTDISLLVIHSISLPPGQFQGTDVEDFFCGRLKFDRHPSYSTIESLKVASHLFIRRNGEIIQFVPFTKRAWHAGESRFGDRSNCNDFSIGIELEGSDFLPYETEQYSQLSSVIKALMLAYPAITAERIVGHCDIAPGRKTDQGPSFDWSILKGNIV